MQISDFDFIEVFQCSLWFISAYWWLTHCSNQPSDTGHWQVIYVGNLTLKGLWYS